MTDRPQSDTLAAALPREMVRVTKIAGQYRQVEMGFIAAALMEAAVERGQKAIDLLPGALASIREVALDRLQRGEAAFSKGEAPAGHSAGRA